MHVRKALHDLLGGMAVWAALGLTFAACACHAVREDTSSDFALKAGQSTVVLGSSCQRDLTLGYGYCQLERGQPLPSLQILFTNPGDYLVSDCQFGVLKTGSAAQPGLVEVDLSPLSGWLQEHPFCLLKIEAVERFPDPKGGGLLREIPIAGGFFIEMLEAGYLPTPSADVIAWICSVERTTKGRTNVSCKANGR